MKCKPLKENILLASVNVILGADFGAKHAGNIVAPDFEEKKDRKWIGAGKTDLVSEAGPYECSLEG